MSIQYLAIAYGKLKNQGKALKLFEKGLQQLTNCNEDLYDNKGNYLYSYAIYLQEIGETAKALQLAQEGLTCMKLYYKNYNHPDIDRLIKLIEKLK